MKDLPTPAEIVTWLEGQFEKSHKSGFSRADLERLTGWSKPHCGDQLRKWDEAGFIRHVGCRISPNIAGRKMSVPLYEFVKHPGKEIQKKIKMKKFK